MRDMTICKPPPPSPLPLNGVYCNDTVTNLYYVKQNDVDNSDVSWFIPRRRVATEQFTKAKMWDVCGQRVTSATEATRWPLSPWSHQTHDGE